MKALKKKIEAPKRVEAFSFQGERVGSNQIIRGYISIIVEPYFSNLQARASRGNENCFDKAGVEKLEVKLQRSTT